LVHLNPLSYSDVILTMRDSRAAIDDPRRQNRPRGVKQVALMVVVMLMVLKSF